MAKTVRTLVVEKAGDPAVSDPPLWRVVIYASADTLLFGLPNGRRWVPEPYFGKDVVGCRSNSPVEAVFIAGLAIDHGFHPTILLWHGRRCTHELISWCKACGHIGEPDFAAENYGPNSSLPELLAGLRCSECGSHDVDEPLHVETKS